MIRFSCHCGHPFSLEDDQAGGLIQCPKCGRLNDVPTLDEVAALARDGTYTLKSVDKTLEPARLAELSLVFGPPRVDGAGREKDLRNTLQDARKAGVDPVSRDVKGQPRAAPPRYDPETGERIRAFELASNTDPLPHQIPVAKAALSYATGDAARRPNPWRILVDLCGPANLFVMFFIFVFHCIAQVVSFGVRAHMYFAAGPLAIIAFLLLAHFANVIEDTGPDARDELPRPLRYAGWRDDLCNPFVRVVVALAFCYWPALAVLNLPLHEVIRNDLAALLAIAGSLFVPAALLTTITSGSPGNLRPDRLLGVMGKCGWSYVLAVFTWFLSLAIYALGYAMTNATLLGWMTGNSPVRGYGAAAYTLLALGIFTMHFFCWQLGLLYRAQQHNFPWVFQRHVKG